MPQELYSVEQVADRLGLHVRTVRNYVRDGKLKAVRIGKQYRIAREDLAALTGLPEVTGERRLEVSSIVQIDGVDRAGADRISTHVLAALNGRRAEDGRLQVETMYDEERSVLKIIVLGDVTASSDLLKLIAMVAGSD
ncbi:helix-turn-helix domain-containing protein [Kribbella sp. NBC_01245]|uniref:helix-turn-helix domain-containing protein n=1 Tax=Kribbella sp. NBC_01245 TaxID=2903578 RepID=UPI002E2BE4CD|nr:helix-turn-helix domain-containing protein [Kribbella sp. NBC_01245]